MIWEKFTEKRNNHYANATLLPEHFLHDLRDPMQMRQARLSVKVIRYLNAFTEDITNLFR